jgi:hypothetical protein
VREPGRRRDEPVRGERAALLDLRDRPGPSNLQNPRVPLDLGHVIGELIVAEAPQVLHGQFVERRTERPHGTTVPNACSAFDDICHT